MADPTKLYTYADAGVACGAWQISSKDGMSLENPVLLVEVLSHSTQEYDRGAKMFLYRQIPSLTDVLLIDPVTRVVEHHHRGARSWQCVELRGGAIPVLGGELPIDALLRLPPRLDAD